MTSLNDITVGQVWNYLFEILGSFRLGVAMWCFNIFMCILILSLGTRKFGFWWWFSWINIPIGMFYLFASAFV